MRLQIKMCIRINSAKIFVRLSPKFEALTEAAQATPLNRGHLG